MNNKLSTLPVAVIGAGPVGLAAAAHLLERGIEPLLLEAGTKVAEHFRQFAHVRLFSPWRYNIDKAASRLLQSHGWIEPDPDELPTAGDLVEQYLEPLSGLPEIASRLRRGAKVVLISREGFDKVKTKGREDSPFVIRYESQTGRIEEVRARAIIDASGTWSSPNPLGANGLPAIGEIENKSRVFYGIPDVLGRDRERYSGRTTLVVGSGHSAANSLLALAKLAREDRGTRLLWAVRGTDLRRVFGGGAADALPARGQLGSSLAQLQQSGALLLATDFRLERIEREGGSMSVIGRSESGEERQLHGIHEIICATGQRPDYTLASELRLKLDPWLESSEALGPLIDPNVHSCGTVRPHGHRELAHPEPGFYTVGVKSYGRAPTFLMATGYEQVRSVSAALAGDFAAADEVQLDLPQTGVCSVNLSQPAGSGACCGTAAAPAAPSAAVVAASACCG
jgi:thioredoxin reductase